jgi:hypothetical protein
MGGKIINYYKNVKSGQTQWEPPADFTGASTPNWASEPEWPRDAGAESGDAADATGAADSDAQEKIYEYEYAASDEPVPSEPSEAYKLKVRAKFFLAHPEVPRKPAIQQQIQKYREMLKRQKRLRAKRRAKHALSGKDGMLGASTPASTVSDAVTPTAATEHVLDPTAQSAKVILASDKGKPSTSIEKVDPLEPGQIMVDGEIFSLDDVDDGDGEVTKKIVDKNSPLAAGTIAIDGETFSLDDLP